MLENPISKDDSSDKIIPLINNSNELIIKDLIKKKKDNLSLSGSTTGSEYNIIYERLNNKDYKNLKQKKKERKKSYDKKLNANFDSFLFVNGNNNKKAKSSDKKILILSINNNKNKNNEDINLKKEDGLNDITKIGEEKNNKIINNENHKNQKDEIYPLIVHPLMDKKSSELLIENFETEKIGFTNIGNTCYMNSFLQILLHTPGFLKELKKERNNNIDLVNSLIGLSEEPYNIRHLKNIKEIMGEVKDSYSQYVQNDSQEFGTDLINTIISLIKGEQSFSDESRKEEAKITHNNKVQLKKEKFIKFLNKYHNIENEIPLEKMFQFYESKIEFESKENNEIGEIKGINFEICINIDLDFQKYKKTNLVDLLNYKYFEYCVKENDMKLTITNNLNENKNLKEEENVNVEENQKESRLRRILNCAKKIISYCWNAFINCICGKKQQNNEKANVDDNRINKKEELITSKRIASLPRILIISINRAFLNNSLNDNIISFNEILDIKKYIDQDLLKLHNTDYKYQLYAINECIGHTKENGHYDSYIKINKKWYKFNDNNVKEEQPNFSSDYVVGLYYINNDL